VAPKVIAEQYGRVVAHLFSRASNATAESRTLAASRDALLPKLISGEVRVKSAELVAPQTAV
jgi:type I restriction enzyme S subunit